MRSMNHITAPIRSAAAWYTARRNCQYDARLNQVHQMRAFALWESGKTNVSQRSPLAEVDGRLRHDHCI